MSWSRHPVASTPRYHLVLVTAPDLKTARRLARAALAARLIACANLIPRLESHYWWQGKIESSAEVWLILKTTGRHLAALEQLILQLHPYDTAEFVALPIGTGSARYLDWIEASVASVDAPLGPFQGEAKKAKTIPLKSSYGLKRQEHQKRKHRAIG